MKITIYKCDECNKILSDDKEFSSHLSIDSGRIQLAHKGDTKHILTHNLLTGIKQFCNTVCLSNYIIKREADVKNDLRISVYNIGL